MQRIRRTMLMAAVAATFVFAPLSVANAGHMEDCHGEHEGLAHAHSTIPHETEGNMTAHGSAPYCPPDDAPRHHYNGGNSGGH